MLNEFTIGFSRTINLGNFESARVEASVSIIVAEGDDTAQLMSEAQATLRHLLEQTWKQQFSERQKNG